MHIIFESYEVCYSTYITYFSSCIHATFLHVVLNYLSSTLTAFKCNYTCLLSINIICKNMICVSFHTLRDGWLRILQLAIWIRKKAEFACGFSLLEGTARREA